jgi:glutamate--cysteine ligase
MAADTMRALVGALFEAPPNANPDGSIGAELELIPVRDRSGHRVRIASGDDGAGTAEIIRTSALSRTWTESIDAYGAPSWVAPDSSRISFEPGGQIEISSCVLPSPHALAISLAGTVQALRNSAAAHGVSLLTSGVDPYNEIDDVALELHAPRYESMTRHFNSIGPSGARMMRQTASLQVSIELGAEPLLRWSLLNALAPYLVAAYANSPVYARRPVGYASYRSHLWQTLDRTRTGLPFADNDPIGAYEQFARGAKRIVEDNPAHLTTLFPEIRPRGFFEIRSMDAMEPERLDSALEFVHRIVHNPGLSDAAHRIVGKPNAELLERAARLGRADPLIGERLGALESLV